MNRDAARTLQPKKTQSQDASSSHPVCNTSSPRSMSSLASHSRKSLRTSASFDCFLKDALVFQLRHVSSSSSDSLETRNLIACGTGIGVVMFDNQLPSKFVATCLTHSDTHNSHSINISNVLVDSAEIDSFRENSIQEMPKIRDKIRAYKILGIRVGCKLIWGHKREGR